jgi:hypothetical protein
MWMFLSLLVGLTTERPPVFLFHEFKTKIRDPACCVFDDERREIFFHFGDFLFVFG